MEEVGDAVASGVERVGGVLGCVRKLAAVYDHVAKRLESVVGAHAVGVGHLWIKMFGLSMDIETMRVVPLMGIPIGVARGLVWGTLVFGTPCGFWRSIRNHIVQVEESEHPHRRFYRALGSYCAFKSLVGEHAALDMSMASCSVLGPILFTTIAACVSAMTYSMTMALVKVESTSEAVVLTGRVVTEVMLLMYTAAQNVYFVDKMLTIRKTTKPTGELDGTPCCCCKREDDRLSPRAAIAAAYLTALPLILVAALVAWLGLTFSTDVRRLSATSGDRGEEVNASAVLIASTVTTAVVFGLRWGCYRKCRRRPKREMEEQNCREQEMATTTVNVLAETVVERPAMPPRRQSSRRLPPAPPNAASPARRSSCRQVPPSPTASCQAPRRHLPPPPPPTVSSV